jgi:hypothetical protein
VVKKTLHSFGGCANREISRQSRIKTKFRKSSPIIEEEKNNSQDGMTFDKLGI